MNSLKIWNKFMVGIAIIHDKHVMVCRILATLYSKLLSNFLINSLLFAIISSITYFSFVKFIDIDIFTEYDDFAFGVVNYFQSDFKYESGQKILVFEIDDLFLKNPKHKLMDSDGLLNKEYNDFFPRKYLIDFINKLDNAEPKLLFIDLDLSKRKASPLDKEGESTIDDKLILLLKKDRAYTIYITHNVNESFIEDEYTKDTEDKRKMNIEFVSTGLVANHNKVRHYQAFKSTDKKEDNPYPFGPLIFSGKDISKIVNAYDVVNNRFIYKDRFVEGYSQKSYWEDISFFSFESIKGLSTEYIKDSIIFIGTNHSNNHDVHTIYDGSKKAGAEILANCLASINYFSPQLKLLPITSSICIIFLITFLVRYVFLCLPVNHSKYFFHSMVVIIIINFLVSYLIVLKIFYFWLNFLAPYTLYILMESLDKAGSAIRIFKNIVFYIFSPVLSYIFVKVKLLIMSIKRIYNHEK